MVVVKQNSCFECNKGATFYPRFEKIYYFDKEFQPLFRDMQRALPGIEFLKRSAFHITKNLPHCLLIYDNSCEEIFNDKEIVKIATSGRHCNLHVIYVKHNLFHQSKWSRTIDLNTTYITFFKSPRDIQQIEYLGKQLNCLQLIEEAYTLATAEPFGHLMIDLDPKTSQGLRFSPQLIGPDPSIFYLSSPEAVLIKKHLLMLKQGANNRNENTAQIKTFHQDDFILFLSDCVINVLSGVVPINKVELKKFGKPLRKLADRRVKKSERIKIF